MDKFMTRTMVILMIATGTYYVWPLANDHGEFASSIAVSLFLMHLSQSKWLSSKIKRYQHRLWDRSSVCLDELQESKYYVPWSSQNGRVAKYGEYGYPYGYDKIALDGQAYAQTLSFHPGRNGVRAFVEYDLRDYYFCTLSAIVGIGDAVADNEIPDTYVVVKANGREVAPPFKLSKAGQQVTWDIGGCRTLRLECYCEGKENNWGFGVWCNPMLHS